MDRDQPGGGSNKETKHEHDHGESPFQGGKAPWTVEAAHRALLRYLTGSRGEQAHATLQIDRARQKALTLSYFAGLAGCCPTRVHID